jgi:peroxiredoxin Q/BCP
LKTKAFIRLDFSIERKVIEMLEPGSMAPDFNLQDDTGTYRRLSDYRGKYVVLYFYPKDDTPGCTVEACSFRDGYGDYARAGVEILGISPDSVKSHVKFKDKFSLPFPLLADVDRQVCEEYGVWGLKKFMGREYFGVLRTTYLIAPDGTIAKVFENVKPAGHSQLVLEAVPTN